MITAYNFIASWQLFPEKGTYEFGNRPKSGIYKIEAVQEKKEISISMNWVTLENQAFSSQYQFIADGELHPFISNDAAEDNFADSIKARFIDALHFETFFYKNNELVLEVANELLPNGYLRITQKGSTPEGQSYTKQQRSTPA